MEGAASGMEIYYVPTVVTVGVSGAVLSCVVFFGTPLRLKFYTHFLICTALSSIGFLVSVLIGWLHEAGLPVYDAPGLCQVVVFSSYFFPFLATWVTLLGSGFILWEISKFVRYKWLESPGKAKVLVIGMAVLGFTLYSHKTWTHGAIVVGGDRICSQFLPDNAASRALAILDTIMLLLLPSLLYLLLLATLTFHLGPCRKRSPLYRARHGQVIRIVLAQSLSYLLLAMPRGVSVLVIILRRGLYGWDLTNGDVMANKPLQYLFYTFYAALAWVPMLFSSKFRRHLCSLTIDRSKRSMSMSRTVKGGRLPLMRRQMSVI